MINKLRILIASDIHLFAKHVAALVDEVSDKYDAVLIPGDFMNLSAKDASGGLTRPQAPGRGHQDCSGADRALPKAAQEP